MKRTHDCACGGSITIEGTDITPAYREHVNGPMHQGWRARTRVDELMAASIGVVLGPCPCSECGVPLVWNGLRWRERDGAAHGCARAAA